MSHVEQPACRPCPFEHDCDYVAVHLDLPDFMAVPGSANVRGGRGVECWVSRPRAAGLSITRDWLLLGFVNGPIQLFVPLTKGFLQAVPLGVVVPVTN
jgi:hypothetical protein